MEVPGMPSSLCRPDPSLLYPNSFISRHKVCNSSSHMSLSSHPILFTSNSSHISSNTTHRHDGRSQHLSAHFHLNSFLLPRGHVLPTFCKTGSRILVVSNEKDKNKYGSKGKKRVQGGGGKLKGQGRSQQGGETTKKASKPRGNVWSRDIAETDFQSYRESSNSPNQKVSQIKSSKERRDGNARDEKERRGSDIFLPMAQRKGYIDQKALARNKVETDISDEDFSPEMNISGGIPVEIQEVLQNSEQMPSPLWPTFVSSNAGVWRGVGAAFSPTTAEMEPVALGSKNEYLYDARVQCTVEQIPGPEGDRFIGSSLYRKVMWTVENPYGEQGFDELLVQSELFEEDDDNNLLAEGINPLELASSATSEGMDYPESLAEVFGTEEETREFLQGLENRRVTLYNPENVLQAVGVLREGDPEWKSMYKAETVDAGLVEALSNVAVGTNQSNESWQEGVSNNVDTPLRENGSYMAGEPSAMENEVWKHVMEEDTMGMEPGLVFFSASEEVFARFACSGMSAVSCCHPMEVLKSLEDASISYAADGAQGIQDGSYSRGPISLLPDDLAASNEDYYKSPTFKIEQCLVTGKHRRLRLVHTIAIMDSGEEVQVLRVAAYGEQWTGPCNMNAISDSGGAQMKPFSQEPRIPHNELTGSWKVFEMSATALHQASDTNLRPAYAYFCQELMQRQGLPEAMDEYVDEDEDDEGSEPVDDPSVLWLPGGITANVEAKEAGILSIGVGWLYSKGTFLLMERDYGPDGRLAEVRSQTKVKGGWAGDSM